ncbi:MAG: inositol monophosphatase [Spartobacteria bacterium]|nr:inositol monophosphatase [Spartobacteria bacterium]
MYAEKELITIAQKAVTEAAEEIKHFRHRLRQEVGREEGGKEVKLLADQVTNDIIVKTLQSSGISILSEETGFIKGSFPSALQWVVDPLDGSVNFLHGIDYCGISVGLCEGDQPIAGVIYDLNKDVLVTGAPGFGAYAGYSPITPSDCTDASKAILTTGFPARMKFDEANITTYVKKILAFNKIRMTGSAVQSCLNVASGRMDAYYEKDIMLWDVAAGIAIIEAAGGYWKWLPGSRPNAKIVYACCPGLKNYPIFN